MLTLGCSGLAFGTINTVKPTPAKTPVENMIAQSDIPKTAELFTVYLSSVKDQGAESFYTFGAIDQTAAGKGQIKYTPVDNSQGFWMFDSPTFSINGQTTEQSGNKAIADTGTTLALVSDAACKAIYAQIKGATYDQQNQGWVFPTPSDVSTLPTVGFAAGDQIYTIQKEVLAFQDLGNGTSYGSIQSRGNNPFDILGDAWLTSIYAVSFSMQPDCLKLTLSDFRRRQHPVWCSPASRPQCQWLDQLLLKGICGTDGHVHTHAEGICSC